MLVTSENTVSFLGKEVDVTALVVSAIGAVCEPKV